MGSRIFRLKWIGALMTDNAEYPRDEISVLDLLVTIAENWLLLVLVPLLAGVATFGFLWLQSPTWTASTVVGLPQAEIARYLHRFDDESPTGAQIAGIRRGLSIAEDSSPERTRLDLTLADPASVTNGLTFLLNDLSTAVTNGDLVWPNTRLQAEIDSIADEIALRERVIERLAQMLEEMTAAVLPDETAYAQAASALDAMIIARNNQQSAYTQLTERLATLPFQLIEQAPSAPTRTEKGSPLLPSVLAALGTGLVLVMLIFIRSGLRNAAADPESREKIDRIRRAFGRRTLDSKTGNAQNP